MAPQGLKLHKAVQGPEKEGVHLGPGGSPKGQQWSHRAKPSAAVWEGGSDLGEVEVPGRPQINVTQSWMGFCVTLINTPFLCQTLQKNTVYHYHPLSPETSPLASPLALLPDTPSLPPSRPFHPSSPLPLPIPSHILSSPPSPSSPTYHLIHAIHDGKH
ncbi:hypothetical protein INR49_019834 [Caranx melampygus]|nr:hypothetical protein INR49_019834 [Caranx melampygus]